MRFQRLDTSDVIVASCDFQYVVANYNVNRTRQAIKIQKVIKSGINEFRFAKVQFFPK